jgi:hypothetical protein
MRWLMTVPVSQVERYMAPSAAVLTVGPSPAVVLVRRAVLADVDEASPHHRPPRHRAALIAYRV